MVYIFKGFMNISIPGAGIGAPRGAAKKKKKGSIWINAVLNL